MAGIEACLFQGIKCILTFDEAFVLTMSILEECRESQTKS